ncbi:MAG: DUF2244 domain-containing protein [Alphaproteobacteria bacterium]|nr:DUF2244 domain-containing protein [Alphaproteobacteria bacterium]
MSEPAQLDVVLTPHRSLGPRGFLVLMAGVSLACFAGGAVFAHFGAWPVVGFFGLDVALVYLAFRASYRSALHRETLRLTPDALQVERIEPSGAVRRWTFQPYWLRVDLEQMPGRASVLRLASHGRSLVVGAFLSAEERASLARALKAALERARTVPQP